MYRFISTLALSSALLIFVLYTPIRFVQAQETTPTPNPTAAPPTPSLPQSHTITAGESLAYIADLYGTTVEALQTINNIADPALINIGQEIILPGSEGIPTPAPVSPTTPLFHIVADGEPLAYIAGLYGTTVEALQLANNIADPALVYVGQELAIPSTTGDEIPTTYRTRYGDTLADIALKFNTELTAVAQFNNLVSPNTLYAGQNLLLLSKTGSNQPQSITGTAYLVQPNDTLWQLAAQHNLVVRELAQLNHLSPNSPIYPGQRLRLPIPNSAYTELPSGWLSLDIDPIAIIQGDTVALTISHLEQGQATVTITNPEGEQTEIGVTPLATHTHQALIAFDAFALPGRYTVEVGGAGLSRPWRPFSQQIVVNSANYGLQEITLNEDLSNLLTPDLRFAENAFLATIFMSSTVQPQWTAPFTEPITNSTVTAYYGDYRSYNGAPIINFHSGIDFASPVGTVIVAPANGTIVYSGTLTVRGNALIIDHGMGVMTAYYHLSAIDVSVGDTVVTGQPIAKGGNTGLSTGPHLHWDIRVWGAAVQPLQWLEQPFP